MNSQPVRFGVMRFMKAVFAVVVCLAGVGAYASYACADTKHDGKVYIGAIGKSAVVVFLYRDDSGQSVGTYFYRAKGVAIGLAAQGKRGQYVECRLRSDNDDPAPCGEPTGYWSIAVHGNTVTGSWRKTSSQAGAALPVVLRRASVPCNLEVYRDGTPLAYYCLRAEGPKQVLGKPQASRDGTLAWRLIEDKRSEAAMLQLTRAPNPAAMAAINRDLANGFIGDINSALGAKPGGESACSHNVALANRRWFVIESGCSWDIPGNAHPSVGWGSTTYDVAAGKKVNWPALIRFPAHDTQTFNFRNGHDIVSLALRHIPENPGEDDDCLTTALGDLSCGDDICTNWEFYKEEPPGEDVILSPHEDGLFVSFNHYAEPDRKCRGEGLTLPWREVRPLLLTPRAFP